eukprot:377000_1
MSAKRTVQIVIKTNNAQKKLNFKFDPNIHTVFDVKQAYCDQHDGSKQPHRLSLRSGRKELKPNSATLASVGVRGKIAMLTLSLVLRGGCFVEGTKVSLSNKKTTNIEDISIGDVVLTYNLNKNKLESFPVKTVLKYLVNVLVKITFSNNSKIICTPSHPFYVPNKRNWCCVKQLFDRYGQLSVG